MEWMPIESAPKSGGSRMLGRNAGPFIMLSKKNDYAPTIAFWNGKAWDDGDFNSSMSEDSFTHWMPLPEPPK